MFGYDRPRTWKWAVPMAIMIVLIPVTWKMSVSPDAEIQFWSMVPCGFGVLALAMAIINAWRLVTLHNQELFTQHQEALSLTPLVLLSQNMKQMHPEAVKVLNRFGVRTSWQVRMDAETGTRDWVLADTNVHFGFIEYVLSHSGKALYPKNRFSEGSKKWDPDHIVEDREQYEEFEKWLFARLMVTRSHGEYKPAEFLPPWTPEAILEKLGLTGVQELYVPEENGKLKDLSATVATKAAPVQVDKVIDAKARDLTDDELEAIRVENDRYDKLLGNNILDTQRR
jgi:hypothetical protein